MSSATARAVAGALRIPQHECPAARARAARDAGHRADHGEAVRRERQVARLARGRRRGRLAELGRDGAHRVLEPLAHVVAHGHLARRLGHGRGRVREAGDVHVAVGPRTTSGSPSPWKKTACVSTRGAGA